MKQETIDQYYKLPDKVGHYINDKGYPIEIRDISMDNAKKVYYKVTRHTSVGLRICQTLKDDSYIMNNTMGKCVKVDDSRVKLIVYPIIQPHVDLGNGRHLYKKHVYYCYKAINKILSLIEIIESI